MVRRYVQPRELGQRYWNVSLNRIFEMTLSFVLPCGAIRCCKQLRERATCEGMLDLGLGFAVLSCRFVQILVQQHAERDASFVAGRPDVARNPVSTLPSEMADENRGRSDDFFTDCFAFRCFVVSFRADGWAATG